MYLGVDPLGVIPVGTSLALEIMSEDPLDGDPIDGVSISEETMSIIPFKIFNLASFLVPLGPTRDDVGPVDDTRDNFLALNCLGLEELAAIPLLPPAPPSDRDSGLKVSENLYMLGDPDGLVVVGSPLDVTNGGGINATS